MGTQGAPTVVKLDDFREADPRPLIKPGVYQAIYHHHAGAIVFKTPKLRVYFQLIDQPAIVLQRWYRVTGYKGRVSAIPNSDLVRELSDVLCQRIRCDRIPLTGLVGLVVEVEVKTVTTDREQRELSERNQYSVISRLKGRV